MTSSALASPLPAVQSLSSSLTKLTETLDPLLNIPFSKLLKELENGSSQQPPQESRVDSEEFNGKEKGKEKEKDEKVEEEEEINELAGMLDSARLRVSVAYVLLDLIWMYLKTKGIDPTTHPVIGELERVKSYFGKIKAAQLGDQAQSGDRQSVDKTAADRFIRAALGSQAKNQASGSSSAIQPSEGVHKRFDFEEDEEEEDDEEDNEEDEEEEISKSKSKEKSKRDKKKENRKEKEKKDSKVRGKRSREDSDEAPTSQKIHKKVGGKGRVVMDVFEGAVTGPPSSSAKDSANGTPQSEKSGKKKKRKSSGGGAAKK